VPDEYVRRVVDEAVTEMKRRLDEYGIPTLARMKCPSSVPNKEVSIER